MNWRIIKALMAKDLTLFFRNRFFALVTVLGVVAYLGIYFAMPKSVDEVLEMGLYAPSLPPIILEHLEDEGLAIQTMESEEALKAALLEGDYDIGAVLSPDFVQKMSAGQKDEVKIYFSPDFPGELKDAYVILFQELAHLIGGNPLDVIVSEEILGIDMGGKQIPPRDRMLSLFTILIIMVETMGLASLLSAEIEGRTLQALLITPMRVEGLFLGKGITGAGLAFAQAAVFLGGAGGLRRQTALLLLTLLLGALMVTGIGFLIASAAKGMMAVLAWGVLAVLVLSVPSFSVMFPGAITGWIRAIPSHYLVDTVHRAANFGAGWGEVWPNLLLLLGFDVVFIALGIATLRRKMR